MIKRVEKMKPSATERCLDRFVQMRAAGEFVIGLHVGEPDFETPEHILTACHDALTAGKTKYTASVGIPELRAAICDKLREDNNLEYAPADIVVSTGAKQALFNTVMAICEEGDEVIIPAPCWVSYVEMVTLAEGTPVVVDCGADFHLDFATIEGAITDKTKAIIICTPNNPTGIVYREDELLRLGQLAVEHNFYIIADEIYEKLTYEDNKHISIASLSDEIKDKCITINGFSKSYAMTGFRLGYCAANKEIIKAVAGIQGHSTSNCTTFVQWAGIAALKGTQEPLETMCKEFDKRRIYLFERLSNMAGVTCNPAEGAFYLMPDISSYFGKSYNGRTIGDSGEFAEYILDEAHVSIVLGSAFFAPNCVRIAYSNSLENIKLAMDAMEEALKKLS